MNRRDFLTGMSAGVSFLTLSSLFPRLAFAANGMDENFFVLIYIPAGWDTSLSMSPWVSETRPQESDYFIEYRKDELIKTSYGLVGPALAPLARYLENIRIINGVFMNATEVGHTSPSVYAMTGSGQGGLSTLSAELDYNVMKMPFGTITSGQIINNGKALNVMSADSLARLEIGSLMDDLIVSESQKSTELTRSKVNLLRYQDRIRNFKKMMDAFKGKNPQAGSDEAIMGAFVSGLSKTAFVNMFSYELDTHSSHPGTHLKTLSEAFQKVANLFDKFASMDYKGTSLLDKTTFMIVSEFTRTPALNTSRGKDHNPQGNSAILMGPKIKPGMMGDLHLVDRATSLLGAPYLAATPIDKITEQPVMRRQDALIIRPENVVATALAAIDLNADVLGASFAGTRVLKTALK